MTNPHLDWEEDEVASIATDVVFHNPPYVRMRKDKEWDEWQVQWIEDGIINEEATYYASDKEDAQGTMAYMIRNEGAQKAPKGLRATRAKNPRRRRNYDEEQLAKVKQSRPIGFVQYDLSNADLRGADLSGAYLVEANLNKADLTRAGLRGADLFGANLRGADLSHAYLQGANLREATLYEANLGGADLRGANLKEANLEGAKLRGANLTRAALFAANLRGADLSHADLRGADLLGAKLSGADLRGATLYKADLRGADLTDASLKGIKYNSLTIWPEGFKPPRKNPHRRRNYDKEQLAKVKKYRPSEFHWYDLRAADLRRADLEGVNLSGANLRDAHLNRAILSRADLTYADLTDADLTEANLAGANLSGANLRDAHLNRANLYNANLKGANLHGANLRGADLRGTDLNDATLSGANLTGAYLGRVNWNKRTTWPEGFTPPRKNPLPARPKRSTYGGSQAGQLKYLRDLKRYDKLLDPAFVGRVPDLPTYRGHYDWDYGSPPSSGYRSEDDPWDYDSDYNYWDFGIDEDPAAPHGYSESIVPERAGPYAGALLESGFRENPAPWYDTFKVKKGALTRFGYHVDESVEKRRRALAKSVAADSYDTTIKRLVLLRTWNKRRPSIYKPVNADVKWLQKNRARLEGKIIEMPTRERRRIAANPRRRKRAR